MEHYHLYHHEIPQFLSECLPTPPVARLREIGMNCGCEYTAFPRFGNLAPYSRFDHSLGVALIVWHFTQDPAQALAGLFHDVSTPVFAHVVDFMRGDYLRQESTEAGTEAWIAGSEEICSILKKHALSVEEVCDYHRYPVADNDSPRLSADRLEYTLGNAVNFGICSREEAEGFYADLLVGTNEDGEDELMFRTGRFAEAFAFAALECSGIYVSDEDRYAMQMLAELLRHAVLLGVVTEADLFSTEPALIARLEADEDTASLWRDFRSYRRILSADHPGVEGRWRTIRAKKRCIDPMVRDRGRVSELSPLFAEKLHAFRESSQDAWLCGMP